MGLRHSPRYADIFMARKIDPQIEDISKRYEEENDTNFMKCFLDDIMKIFIGSALNLHMLFDHMNSIHPNIKFTMIHTTNILEDVATRCACPELSSIPFLDTSCQIINGQIILDLYKKPTDRNMYLLPSLCHPPLQHENIQFSAAMRINRICTEKETRDHRLSELYPY